MKGISSDQMLYSELICSVSRKSYFTKHCHIAGATTEATRNAKAFDIISDRTQARTESEKVQAARRLVLRKHTGNESSSPVSYLHLLNV